MGLVLCHIKVVAVVISHRVRLGHHSGGQIGSLTAASYMGVAIIHTLIVGVVCSKIGGWGNFWYAGCALRKVGHEPVPAVWFCVDRGGQWDADSAEEGGL